MNKRGFSYILAGAGLTVGLLTVSVRPSIAAQVVTKDSCGYPYGSGQPSIVFNESEVLRAFYPNVTADGKVIAYYNDESALELGVRQVSTKTKGGTTVTQNFAFTDMPTVAPLLQTTAPQVGNLAAIDGE